MTLSIIIPVYNEEKTINELLDRVERVDLGDMHKEIIVVDDGSRDQTRSILAKRESAGSNSANVRYRFFYHDYNQGKGAGIRTGLANAIGEIIVVQDADLEYDPNDYQKLLEPILSGQTNVVYGSRAFYGVKRYSSLLFHLGGEMVTWWANILYRTKLTDEATCYKMFRRKALDGIALACERFEFCPEITAKFLKKGEKIVEVPISYNPRSLEEGKKIKPRDGLEALWTLTKIRFFD